MVKFTQYENELNVAIGNVRFVLKLLGRSTYKMCLWIFKRILKLLQLNVNIAELINISYTAIGL